MDELGKAVELYMAGRLEEARRACRKLVQRRADLVEAHVLLAEIQRVSGESERERQSVARVLKLRPQWSEAHVHLALADWFSDFQRLPDAEEAYRRALDLRPELSDARYNLAALLGNLERMSECIDELHALLRHEPGARDAREQLVRLLQDARRWDEVEVLCRSALSVHPQDSFFAQKLGVALWWKGSYEAALEAYRLAARSAGYASPAYHDARFLEATGLLTLGRNTEGWPAYASRPSRLAAQARNPEIVADPQPLTGDGRRIRIYAEQGLGDELFFLRFAPALRARGHRLSLVCQPKLARFLAQQDALFDEVNAASPGDVDLCAASGDLPVVSAQESAPPLPLKIDGKRAAELAESLRTFGPPPYVGATWRAGSRAWGKEIPCEALAAAFAPLNASIVILQRNPQGDELHRFRQALGRDALDLSAAVEELSDALAVLSVLNDYVGVSNTNMHLLAGLRGRSARVLVPTPPEWRWGMGGSRSSWFPDFSLYRQRVGSEWGAATAALRDDLRQANAA